MTGDVALLAFHPVLGLAAGTGGRDDDVVAGTPVGRRGHAEGVGGLQALENAQELVSTFFMPL